MITDLEGLVKALHSSNDISNDTNKGKDEASNEQPNKLGGKFYADSETLKQGSGYYEGISALPVDTSGWIENCQDCHIPMTPLQATGEILGIPDSVHVSHRNKSYTKWVQDGCRFDNNKIWLCPVCSSAWSIIKGQFWAKLIINNQYTFRTENIKSYPKPASEEVYTMLHASKDKPSPDATICSDCNVYREIIDHDDMYNRHVCPKCHSGSLVEKQPKGE